MSPILPGKRGSGKNLKRVQEKTGSEEKSRERLGSSGIAIKILYDELRSRVTPYEPANKIIFGAGALEGTTAPGACKMTVSTLGPVTGGWASGAIDSWLGDQVKYTGFDLVVIEEKAQVVVFTELLHGVANCLGISHYNTVWYDLHFMSLPEMADLYSAATGWETSVEDLKRIAEKQLNLEKAFNLRHTNFDRRDDMPTPRDLNEPIPTGNLAGWKIDEEKYNRMLDEYYELHGWDKRTSFPTRKTLVALGLEYAANDLEKIGKLR